MDWSYVAGYFDGEGSVKFSAAPSRPNYTLIGLTWGNTHLESLEAIHAFIGCGTWAHSKVYGGYKQMHQLKVERVEDILRVGTAMLPFLIIRRDTVGTMLTWAREHREPQHHNWGSLNDVGVVEMTRLYHEEGLTQAQIGEKFRVSAGAVSTFFLRHGIKGRRRGPKEGAYGIIARVGTEKIIAMYEEGMKIDEIAQQLSIKPQTIYMHLYHKGIRLTATKAVRRARKARQEQGLFVEDTLDAQLSLLPLVREVALSVTEMRALLPFIDTSNVLPAEPVSYVPFHLTSGNA